jgi:Transposase DDE domain
MVKVQEAENRIVIDFEVYDQRPSDSDLLIPGIEIHEQRTGRTPDLVVADAGFFSAKNETKAQEMGVKRVSVPSRSTKSAARKQHQKQRWFKKGQNWRNGCEGRISLWKRRHGLDRSRYKNADGMKRVSRRDVEPEVDFGRRFFEHQEPASDGLHFPRGPARQTIPSRSPRPTAERKGVGSRLTP